MRIKNFLSKSLAIKGSKTIDVLPLPEPPQTNVDWNLDASGRVAVFPVSEFF